MPRTKPPIIQTKLIPVGFVQIPGVEMQPNGKGGFTMKDPGIISYPKPLSPAQMFASYGGMAGTGKSKARDPKKMRAAALKRWRKHGKNYD